MRSLLTFLFIAFFAQTILAENANEAAPAGEAENVLSKEEVYDNLKFSTNLKETIDSLKKWDEKWLKSDKVFGGLKAAVADVTVMKSDKVAIIDFLTSDFVDAEAVKPSDLGRYLLSLLRGQVTSPTLLELIMNRLIHLENVKNNDVITEIQQFVDGVIEDAIKKPKEQEYLQALHIACIRTITASRFSEKIYDAFLKFLKKPEEVSPQLQISIFEALGNVTRRLSKLKLKKRHKMDLLKSLLKIAVSNPARESEGSSTANDLASLKAILIPIMYLASDEDLSYQKKDVVDLFVKLLIHPEITLVKSAAKGLYSIKRTEINERGPTINLANMLTIAATKVSALKGNYGDHLQTYLDTMIQLSSSLLKSKQKDDRNSLTILLKFFNKIIQSDQEKSSARASAMEGFFNFEPAVFAQDTLSKESLAEIETFFNYSLALLEKEASTEDEKRLKERCSEILYEMTGLQYGSDVTLWKKWTEKEGSRYFK